MKRWSYVRITLLVTLTALLSSCSKERSKANTSEWLRDYYTASLLVDHEHEQFQKLMEFKRLNPHVEPDKADARIRKQKLAYERALRIYRELDRQMPLEVEIEAVAEAPRQGRQPL